MTTRTVPGNMLGRERLARLKEGCSQYGSAQAPGMVSAARTDAIRNAVRNLVMMNRLCQARTGSMATIHAAAITRHRLKPRSSSRNRGHADRRPAEYQVKNGDRRDSPVCRQRHDRGQQNRVVAAAGTRSAGP